MNIRNAKSGFYETTFHQSSSNTLEMKIDPEEELGDLVYNKLNNVEREFFTLVIDSYEAEPCLDVLTPEDLIINRAKYDIFIKRGKKLITSIIDFDSEFEILKFYPKINQLWKTGKKEGIYLCEGLMEEMKNIFQIQNDQVHINTQHEKIPKIEIEDTTVVEKTVEKIKIAAISSIENKSLRNEISKHRVNCCIKPIKKIITTSYFQNVNPFITTKEHRIPKFKFIHENIIYQSPGNVNSLNYTLGTLIWNWKTTRKKKSFDYISMR